MKAVTAVRVLALVSLALGLMCAALAFAWRAEHESAECWRAMAQYKIETEGLCEKS
jgi:hypothetical protein